MTEHTISNEDLLILTLAGYVYKKTFPHLIQYQHITHIKHRIHFYTEDTLDGNRWHAYIPTTHSPRRNLNSFTTLTELLKYYN